MKYTAKISTSYKNSFKKSLNPLTESFASYKALSDSISSSLSTITERYSTITRLNMNNITESLHMGLDAYTQANITYLSNSISASLQEMRKSFNLYETAYISETFKEISESMRLFTANIASEQLKLLHEIDYSALFADIIPQSSSLSQIVNSAYSIVQDELLEDDEQNNIFTEEEIQEALQEQASNPKGFQERIANWTEKKKIQFFIIWQLISFIYGNFLQPYFQENIGIPVTAYIASNVKELPQKGANIICKLKEDIEAIIVEDTNYYYKVSFQDENGNLVEGYVAKRNLKKIEKNVQNETDE